MSEFELTKATYIDKHNASLVAGLQHDDFRRQKINWVAGLITKSQSKSLLDFGFGTGELLEDLLDLHSGASLSGIEPSDSLREEMIGRHQPTSFLQLLPTLDAVPDSSIDLMTCFNVLHHVPVKERPALSEQMISKLTIGGRLLIWEHNPYNPATQFIVGRCEYDDDAILLSRTEAQNLFAKLKIETSHYVNVTPPTIQRFSLFRWIEQALKFLPIGAQYRIAFRRSS